jgi:putative spermidine/putrescine transport system ATP-binding protein
MASPVTVEGQTESQEHMGVSVVSHGAEIALSGISKQYGQMRVVYDVSLTINPGEFVTLLGPSGSGKTTLLRILAGLIPLDKGKVVVDGKDISRVPVHKREMGLVFQSYALFPHMTVHKNIAFPLAMKKYPKSEWDDRISEALRAVQLTGFSHRRPRELSGGQQQRVALARAIVSQPRVLLLDEPLGALDRRLREALQVEISTLSHELNLTVINVTHDQEEALIMSDRIALLGNGRLVQYGTPEELYGSPATHEVAEFLGDANLFRGAIEGDGPDRRFQTHDGHSLVPPPTRMNVPEVSEGVLVVRPSAIRISSGDANRNGRNSCSLPGTVARVFFAGESRRVLVATPSGQQIKVTSDIHENTNVRPGDRITLTWDASASVITRSA